MFWSSPSGDISDTVFLIIIAFIVSAVLFVYKRKALLSIFVFSVLSNIIFNFQIGHRTARIYDIEWLLYFSRYVWPAINIALLGGLIFSYLKNVKRNQKRD